MKGAPFIIRRLRISVKWYFFNGQKNRPEKMSNSLAFVSRETNKLLEILAEKFSMKLIAIKNNRGKGLGKHIATLLS